MAVDYLSALNSRGSGLNITQLVDSLVEAETKPKQDLINNKIEDQNATISALAEVAVELDELKSNSLTYQNSSKFVTSSANTAATLTVSSNSNAKAFSSDINISSLATPQTLEFSGFNSPTSTSGSGTITVEFGNQITGSSTDIDSLFLNTSVSASTSLGTPTTHSSLGGKVSIKTSDSGNQSSTVFTVIGTDMAGNVIQESISGSTSGNTSIGSKVFKTVTSITPGSTVGTGSVTIGHVAASFGADSSKSSKIISISSGATISSIASSLNSITGVNANVLNKGDGTYSLVIRSATGASNALQLAVSEASGDSGLSTFDTTSDNANHQTAAATDCVLTVDGVSISRSSNSIKNLYDGYTLDVSKTTTSSFRVSSTLDKSNALTIMENFVEQLNKTRNKLNELTAVASGTNEGGPLNSNIAAKSIKDGINKLLTGPIVGYGSSPLYLSELGVRTNQDGTLSLNESTFNSKLDTNSKVFDSIFTSMFSSSSEFLTVESSTGTSTPTPGGYSFSFDGSTAVLNGGTMTSGTDSDGDTFYLSASSPTDTAGIRIYQKQSVDNAIVYYGKSLVQSISDYVDKVIKTSGTLTKAQTNANTELSEFNEELLSIDDKIENLKKNYNTKFGAMEKAVTSLKSTGDYLTNMLDAWNKED